MFYFVPDLFDYSDDDSGESSLKTNLDYNNHYSKKTDSNKSIKSCDKDGCFCRACDEFYPYAAPDYVIGDGKMTCWRCGTHIFRKFRGLPSEKVEEIDKIYKNK